MAYQDRLNFLGLKPLPESEKVKSRLREGLRNKIQPSRVTVVEGKSGSDGGLSNVLLAKCREK